MASFALAEDRFETMKALGTLIDLWVTRTGKSLAGFAQEVGCSERQAYRWANEQQRPGNKYRPGLAEALDLSPEDLRVAIDLMDVRAENESSERSPRREPMREKRTEVTRPVVDQSPYPSTPLQKLRWSSAVRSDASLSSEVRTVLQALLDGSILTDDDVDASFREFEQLAELLPGFDASDVADVWPDVLSSGYVERRFPDHEWVVRLRFKAK